MGFNHSEFEKRLKKQNKVAQAQKKRAEKQVQQTFENGGYKDYIKAADSLNKSIGKGFGSGKTLNVLALKDFDSTIQAIQKRANQSGFDDSAKSKLVELANQYKNNQKLFQDYNSLALQRSRTMDEIDRSKLDVEKTLSFKNIQQTLIGRKYGEDKWSQMKGKYAAPTEQEQYEARKLELKDQLEAQNAKIAPYLDVHKTKKRYDSEKTQRAEADRQLAYEVYHATKAEAYKKDKRVAALMKQLGVSAADTEEKRALNIVNPSSQNAKEYAGQASNTRSIGDQLRQRIKELGYDGTDEDLNETISYMWDDAKRKETLERNKAAIAQTQAFTQKHPHLASVKAATIDSIAKMLGAGYALGETVRAYTTDKPVKMDPNSIYFTGSNDYQAIVQKRKDMIKSETGKEVYELSMSMADNIARAAATKFMGPVGEGVGLGMMALNVMSDTSLELTKQGYSAEAAGSLAAVAAIAEVFTEKIGLDNLMKAVPGGQGFFKTVISTAAKQAVPEGLEEVASDVINDAADFMFEMLSDSLSQKQNEIKAIMDKEHVNVYDAFRKWQSEHRAEYLKDGFSGAVSGFLLGGGTQVIGAGLQMANRTNYKKQNAKIIKSIQNQYAEQGETVSADEAKRIAGKNHLLNQDYQSLINEGLNHSDGTVRRAAKEMQTALTYTGTVSNFKAGRLINAIQQANYNETKGIATHMLESVNAPQKVIAAVQNILTGGEISRSETKSIKQNENARAILEQLYESATGEQIFLNENMSREQLQEVAAAVYGATFDIDTNSNYGTTFKEAVRLRGENKIGFNGVKGFVAAYNENMNLSLAEYSKLYTLAYDYAQAGKEKQKIVETLTRHFGTENELEGLYRSIAIEYAIENAKNDIRLEQMQTAAENKKRKQKTKQEETANQQQEKGKRYSETGLEEDTSEADPVTKEAVESAKKLSRLSESEKAEKYKNGGAIVESKQKLSTQQSAIISFYDYRGKKHGITYRFVDKVVNDARGTYKDNIITIQINGIEDMTSAAGHELGHYLQENFPEEYKALQDYIKNTLFKQKGISFEEEILKTIANYKENGQNIDRDMAFEEITNDCLFGVDMASSEYEEFVRANESLMQKAFRVIRELLEDLQHFMEDWRKQLPGLYRKVTNIDMIQALYDDVEFMEYTADWVDGILNRTANEVAENANEVAKNENTTAQSAERFSFGNSKADEQRDKAYMQAARNGDEAKAAEYVEQAAKEWGAFSDGNPAPINLYHGTMSFGFTEFDLKKMDDGRSIFLTSDEATAQSYSGVDGKRKINERSNVNLDGLTPNELAKKANEVYSNRFTVEFLSKQRVKTAEDDAIKKLRIFQNLIDSYDNFKDIYPGIEDIISIFKINLEQNDIYSLISNINAIVNMSYPNYRSEFVAQKYFKSLNLDYDTLIENIKIKNRADSNNLDESNHFIRYDYYNGGKMIAFYTEDELKKRIMDTLGRGNYSLYAKFNNPLVVDCEGRTWDNVDYLADTYRFEVRKNYIDNSFEIFDRDSYLPKWVNGTRSFSSREEAEESIEKYLSDENHWKKRLNHTRAVSEYAQENGYDGVIFKNIRDNGGRGSKLPGVADYIAVAFDSSQVKSADPITYDDNGEIIPLSERFSDDKDIRYSFGNKKEQFDIIQKANPAEDDYHTWIRSVDDIRTYDEIMSEIVDEDDFGGTPDFTYKKAKNAIKSGRITVYSSKPIVNGEWVTPSKQEAESFAGSKTINTKRVNLADIAWVDELQGQYARQETVADVILKSFGITKLGDYRQVQEQVLSTLSEEGFFDDDGRRIETNEASGMVVEINESGIDETFSVFNFKQKSNSIKLLKLATIREIPNAIKNGTLTIDDAENYHNKKSDARYAYIEHEVKILGVPCKLKIAIRKSLKKNKFWVHQIYVDEIKKVTFDLPVRETSGTGLLAESDNDMITKHFSIVKNQFANTLTPEQQAAIERKAQRREMAKFQRENDELKEALAAARQQRILSKDYRHNKSQTPKIAKRLLRQMSVIDLSDAERERFIDALDYLYDTIDDNKLENSGGSDVTLMAAMEAVDIIRNRIQYTEKYEELAGRAQEFADYFKGRTYISEAQAKELRYHFGGVDKANQLVHGLNFAIAKGGETTLDMQWREIMETFPDFINEELTDTDEPLAIIKAMQDAREMIDGTLYSPFEVEKLAERAAGEDLESIDFAEAELMNDLAMKLIDSYSDAEWKATFADRKKVQKTVALIKQKQKFRESMRKWRIKTRESEKNKAQKGLNAYKAKVAESRKKATERKRQTEYKNKIKKIAFELGSMAANPNKKKHIPNGLMNTTREFLSMIETGDMTQERLNQYVGSISQEFEMLDNRPIYQSLKSHYNAQIHDMLMEVVNRDERIRLKELSSKDLEKVYKIARIIKQAVSDMNLMHYADKNRTVVECQNALISEKKGKIKLKESGLQGAYRKFRDNELKPVYFFESLNSPTMSKLYQALRAGQAVVAQDTKEAEDVMLRLRKKHGYSKWDLQKTYKFKLAHCNKANEVELSLPQIMSLKALSEREAGLNHLLDGGFQIRYGTDARRTTKGKFKRAFKSKIDKTEYRITADELQTIINTLTPEQVAFVHEMRDYLAHELSKKGNEVSRKMWDIEIFGEDKYFPIHTSDEFNAKGDQKVIEGKMLKNWGSSKQLVPHAHNPLVLEEFGDVWAGHVEEMANYHAFTLPLEDFQKVYGYSNVLTAEEEHQLLETNPDDDILQTVSIQNLFTNSQQQYIEKFVGDVNGSIIKLDETLSTRGISKYKKISTALNLRVTVQQPGAIARAFLYISPKYFAKTTGTGLKGIKSDSAAVQEMEKYSDAAFFKSLGFFDVGEGRSIKEYLNPESYEGKQKFTALAYDGDYRDSKMLAMPEMMDRITWLHIWNAAKAKVAAEEHLTGEALLKRTGEVFNDVVDKTQVYDSIFTRSGHMRSNNPFTKMATAFLAEPTTTINMLHNAWTQYRMGNAKKGFVAKAFAACFTATFLTNLLASVVSAMRHGKDDDNWWELWVGEFTADFLTDIVLVNSIPIVRDLFNLTKGWNVERADMTLASNFIDAVKKLTKAQQNGTVTATEWYDFMAASAAMIGVPVLSLKKDIFGIFQAAKIMSNGTSPTYEGFKKALKTGWYDASAIDDILSLPQPSTNKYDTIYQLYAGGKYDKADARMEALIKKELKSTKPEYGESESEMEKRIREKIESGWENYIKQQMFDKSEFETIYQFMLNGDTKKAVEMKKSLLKESLENVVLMKDEKKEQGQARVKEYFEKTYQSFMQGKLKDKKEIVSAAKVLSAGNLNQAKTAIANLTKQGFTEEDVLKSIYKNINAQIPEGEDFSRDGAIFRVSYSRSLEANALVNTKSMKNAALADIDHDIKTRVRIQNSLRNSGYKQDDIRRATDYLKSQLKNDSKEDDEDEEKSIFKASDLGWATLKADTATIRVCAKGYTEFYLKTHKDKTEKDAKKNIRTQISTIVKDEYYKASSDKRKQIQLLMYASGAYDSSDAVRDVCSGWVKEIAKKKFGN